MKRIGTFLIALALVAGMVGCGDGNGNGNGNGTVSYQLTISSTAGGSVVEPGDGVHVYEEGTVVDLVAQPDTGHRFVSWTGDAGSVADVDAASTTITINGDYYITASFEEISEETPVVEYELTVDSTSGGEVTIPGEGKSTFDGGTVVDLVAEAEEGYEFVNWTGNVGTIANVNAASTTITMNGDYSITANFEEIQPVQYVLTISSTIGGSVTTPGEGIFSYSAGTVVDLVATPAICHLFVSWTGNVGTIGSVSTASTMITMNGSYQITASFEEDQVVNFPDSNLKAAIREAIGKPTGGICRSDLEGLTQLSARERNVIDLTGLEYCSNLAALDLVDNEISDVVALHSLTNMTELGLGWNQISDISPLSNLISMKTLHLVCNQICDVSPLFNLTNLTELYLCHNPIGEISPLANLTRLTTLSLQSSQISDISPLANLTKLTGLMLTHNQVADISPLANLTGLTILGLDHNQIADVSPLASVTSLTQLGLGGNQVSDISPLAELTSLTELGLGGNLISDISPLLDNHGLGEGDRVDLRWNPLSEQSINEYIPALQARGVTVDY